MKNLSLKQKIDIYRHGKRSTTRKNELGDILDNLSGVIPSENTCLINPDAKESYLKEGVFKTYSEAKKYIQKHKTAPSDTNKYLIKLPAGKVDASIAGNAISGEEGCIHLDSNVIVECNDATVVTCPVKSNGSVTDIGTDGYDALYRYFIYGGTFHDVQGTETLFAFSGSYLEGLNLSKCGIYAGAGTILGSGQMYDLMFAVIQKTTFMEDAATEEPLCKISLSKDNFKCQFFGVTGRAYLNNPTDTSILPLFYITNSNIRFYEDADKEYHYELHVMNSEIGIKPKSEDVTIAVIMGKVTLLNSKFSLDTDGDADLTFSGNVNAKSGEIESVGAGTLLFNDDAIVHLLSAYTVSVGNGYQLRVVGVCDVETWGTLDGIVSINPKYVQNVVADTGTENVSPGSKIVTVSGTSTNSQTINIPDYLLVEGYEIVMVDVDDASANNITVQSSVNINGQSDYVINIAKGYVHLIYDGSELIVVG